MVKGGKEMTNGVPVRASYIWISGQNTHHDIRGKDRTLYYLSEDNGKLPLSQMSPTDLLLAGFFPEWNFDGSSTEQAKGLDTEILCRPVAAYHFPSSLAKASPSVPRYIVLCDCYLSDGVTPTPDNTRYIANNVFRSKTSDVDALEMKPWFGMEQECVLVRCAAPHRPIGWPKEEGSFPPPQGAYYCGNGPSAAPGRIFSDTHYEWCLAAGLHISGTNGEVMPGQWEFQVGPCQGISMGDELVVARWLYLRMLEQTPFEGEYFDLDFRGKPIAGDWNGSGLHTNFSTEATRSTGTGLLAINSCLERLKRTLPLDLCVYGDDNDKRLTGIHETSRFDQFSFGIGTRGTSVRIPNCVAHAKCGYFEDRRPAADCDPYLVSARLFASACGIDVPLFDRRCEAKRRDWMPKI